MGDLNFGSLDIANIRLGTVQVLKIMCGATQVWPNGGYGRLYNWYAANDSRHIASAGWHLPSTDEWDAMVTFLGPSLAGGKLKESGTVHWNAPNTDASNSSGFNASGSGYLTSYFDFNFSDLKIRAFYLTTDSSPDGTIFQSTRPINCNSGSVDLGMAYGWGKECGLPMRLLKDSTSLTVQGQKGSYTGNDGTVYESVLIGTQEWITSNLKETKYRNLEVIPNVTDWATWHALKTGAWCYYNHAFSNL
jgi:uncharacterized protein (TIGR02145 family)